MRNIKYRQLLENIGFVNAEIIFNKVSGIVNRKKRYNFIVLKDLFNDITDCDVKEDGSYCFVFFTPIDLTNGVDDRILKQVYINYIANI